MYYNNLTKTAIMKSNINNFGLKVFGTGKESNIFEVTEKRGKILIMKTDLINYLSINRKTIDSAIKRSKGSIHVYKENKISYLDIKDVLFFLSKHYTRKNNFNNK